VEIIETIINRNQHSSGHYSRGCHSGNSYGKHVLGSHQGGNKYQRRRRNQEGSTQCTEKSSSERGAGNPNTFFAETDNSKVCLSANKDITWVILVDYVAMDHLVKEDTHVINKYKLSAPSQIHIAKNNNYLLAYEKGDVIGETYVNGEVRNVRILNVFLLKDLSYNSLSVSKLEFCHNNKEWLSRAN
jgi:hypothetical protein